MKKMEKIIMGYGMFWFRLQNLIIIYFVNGSKRIEYSQSINLIPI